MSAAVDDPAAPAPVDDGRRLARLRRNARFLAAITMIHPKLFAVAIAGAAVFAASTIVSSVVLGRVIDNVILPRFEDGEVAMGTVLAGLGLIVGVGVIRAISIVVRRGFASAMQWRVAQTLTGRVVDQLVRQPIAWHSRRADGDLVARAGVDTETTVSVLAPIPFATGTVLMVIGSTIWLFVIDVPMGVVAAIVFPLLVATNVVYERAVAHHFARAQNQLGDFSAGVHESFEGVQVVKSYGAEDRETERLSHLASDVRESRITAIRIRSWFEAFLDAFPSMVNIGLVVLGAWRVESGDLTVGEISSVIFLFQLLVFPLRLIGYTLSELPRSIAAWQRIDEVVSEPLEPDPAKRIEPAAPGVGAELDAVTFAHVDGSPPTITDVAVSLPAGSVTAVVGPTGSGKSTVAQLVVGLLGPSAGTVRRAPGAAAIVFQEAFLLAGTIRENVEFGGSFSDDQLWDALSLAAADDFVRNLPHALDTIVGERGVTLSGGQRQRVALARAMIREPSLLVLDDTTSALDPATEAIVLGNLRRRLTTASVVLIATRPSTIALANDVVFVDGGRIAAHGDHDDLLRTVPRYRELVEAFEADRGTPS
ncbi:MAG: ABC transporter ATP-binding protein [Ilumatobacteraceae bacterium]|nr:ABC transporter ATP-binding protein [Ilumatobacteraceae bacterium]